MPAVARLGPTRLRRPSPLPRANSSRPWSAVLVLTGGDRGSASLEIAILAPALLLLTFVVVQAGLWFYARNLALAAAQEGVTRRPRVQRPRHGRTRPGSRVPGRAGRRLADRHDRQQRRHDRPPSSGSPSPDIPCRSYPASLEWPSRSPPRVLASTSPSPAAHHDPAFGDVVASPCHRSTGSPPGSGSGSGKHDAWNWSSSVPRYWSCWRWPSWPAASRSRRVPSNRPPLRRPAPPLSLVPPRLRTLRPAPPRTTASPGRTSTASRLDVSLDTAGFAVPVGQPAQVAATISCDVDLSALAVPGVPGAKTLSARTVSVLDRYRSRALPADRPSIPSAHLRGEL